MFKIIINFFKRRQQKKVLNRIDKKDVSDNYPKKETDPYIVILSDSNKRIDKLKIYKNYFNHILLDKIIMQSETVHNIFESNKELKYNKLEQFHYYYTDHLIELLDKIKSNKEESKSMLETQMNSYIYIYFI